VLASGAESLSEIPESTIDIAFSLNSLHHFNDKAAVFAEVLRVLKVGGRFYVRDFIKNWMTRHGTRREEVAGLPATGFSDRRVNVTWSSLEATFTK
jgi:ubiquinone/menaquinone biosynthesis C-methylase UbiE